VVWGGGPPVTGGVNEAPEVGAHRAGGKNRDGHANTAELPSQPM
jgi:hypothetical protein